MSLITFMTYYINEPVMPSFSCEYVKSEEQANNNPKHQSKTFFHHYV